MISVVIEKTIYPRDIDIQNVLRAVSSSRFTFFIADTKLMQNTIARMGFSKNPNVASSIIS